MVYHHDDFASVRPSRPMPTDPARVNLSPHHLIGSVCFRMSDLMCAPGQALTIAFDGGLTYVLHGYCYLRYNGALILVLLALFIELLVCDIVDDDDDDDVGVVRTVLRLSCSLARPYSVYNLTVYEHLLRRHPTLNHAMPYLARILLSVDFCAPDTRSYTTAGAEVNPGGEVRLRGEVLHNTRDNLVVNFRAKQLANKEGFFSTSDPFLKISRWVLFLLYIARCAVVWCV
jgi:hypothetical protein